LRAVARPDLEQYSQGKILMIRLSSLFAALQPLNLRSEGSALEHYNMGLENRDMAYIDTHRLRTRLLDGLLCQSGRHLLGRSRARAAPPTPASIVCWTSRSLGSSRFSCRASSLVWSGRRGTCRIG
jgi:hypothetical protein